MHMSFSKWGMRRWFLCLGLFGIISTLIIGGYSYKTVSDTLFMETEKSSHLQMKQANDKMYDFERQLDETTSRIEMRNDIFDIEGLEAYQTFNAYLRGIIPEKEIGACFVRTADGREFKYNPDTVYEDMVYLQLFCNNNIGGNRKFKWINGDNENYVSRHENYYIVCTTIKQTNEQEADVYYFVKKDVVTSILNSFVDKNNITIIIDNGRILAVSDKERLNNITKITTNILMSIYEKETGSYKFGQVDKDYIISHYQMSTDGFKYLAIYETKDFYKESYRILRTIALIIFLLCASTVLFYMMIRSQYIKPFKRFVNKMANIDRETEEITDIEGNEEIRMLSHNYNEMVKKIGIMLQDIREKEESKRQAEVAALRYQINPHFFYNTLSNIKMLAISKGQNEISETISKFGNVYRYLFSNKSNFVSVSEEIEFIKNYVSLMNSRYNDLIHTFYLVDDTAKNCKMPIFLLQPITENAIVHGLSKKLNSKKECFLRISVASENDNLIITVRDDGIGIPQEKIEQILAMRENNKQVFGLGLYNTIARLNYQYGDNYDLKISSVINEYTEVIITIPVNKEPE